MKILDIAYYTIQYCNESLDGITHLKLQKLLYYTKVWGIVSGKDVVDGDFYHWDYGPVNWTIWKEFKKYGKEPIPSATTPASEPTGSVKDFIDFILKCYAHFNALQLSKMTHIDTPWKDTPKDAKISENQIKQYYSKKNFAKNFPLSSNGPFYPVETDSHYSYMFDMDDQMEDEIYYPSFQDYLDSLKTTHEELDKFLEKLGQSSK